MIVSDTVSFVVHVDSERFSIKTKSTNTTAEAAWMIGLACSLQYLHTSHLPYMKA